MQTISPFIWFDNNAGEAIDFYLGIFKDSKKLRVAENPMGAGLLVASVQLAGQEVIFMNGGPGHPQTDAFSLTINCTSQEEVDYYWEKLLEGGGNEIACGWLKDKFGLHWQVTPVMLPELIADKDKAKASRVMQAMMKMIKLDIATLQAAADGK